MKKTHVVALVCGALALFVPSFLAAQGSVTLSSLAQAPAGNPPNGIPVTITVDAVAGGGASINGVYLLYRTLAEGAQDWWVTNEMAVAEGDTYTGTIPPLAAGEVEYRISCLFDETNVQETDVASYTISDLPSVASGRYMPFDETWTQVVESNYYYNVDSGAWTGSGIRRSAIGSRVPDGGTSPVYQLLAIEGAYIQSPSLQGGVGSIYFTSQMSNPYHSSRVLVQVSTNSAPESGDWETVKVLIYPRVSYIRYQNAAAVVVNRADVKSVRIILDEPSPYDTSASKLEGTIAFDNIVISYPPADVRIEERLRNPGYPSRDQEVKLRCAVIDTNPNAPTVNHRVTVYYQWLHQPTARPQDGAWLSTNMYPIGNGVYEGEIPRYEPGYVYYYYKCDFDGFYYSRDPDGPDGVQPTNIENLSPNYWANGETLPEKPTYYTTRYQVRPFRSEYGEVWVDATPVQASVPMELVGDEIWQGITLVTGITNLNWHFVGHNRYTNDAPAYLTTPVVWGDNDQSFANPPIGGYAEVNATNALVLDMEYTGFMLLRLTTTNGNYIGKRAVYQNFDEWQASKDQFEESLGLYAVKTYREDFDTWRDDGYTPDQIRGEPFQNDTPSDTYSKTVFQTKNGWLAQQARVVAERKPDNKPTTIANQSLLLNRLAGGWVGNSGDSLTRGIEKLTYSVRASINDTYYAVYKEGYGWEKDLKITTTFCAADLSPEFPYISTLVCFQPDYFLGASFYEVRLIQGNETAGGSTDNRLYVEVWRWNAGADAPTKIGSTQGVAGKLIADKQVVITISGTVSITVKVGDTTLSAFTDNSADNLTGGGTIGFLTHDAVPMIKSVLVQTTATPVTTRLDQQNFSDVSKWHLGGPRADGGGNRWSTTSYDGTVRLTRAVPTQKMSIWKATRRAGATRPDVGDYELQRGDIVVNSLSYTNAVEYLKIWNEGFVELRHDSGDADIVVDDPRLYPWRANTRGPSNLEDATVGGVKFFNWTSKEQQDQWLYNSRGWAVLEGMVTNSIYNPNNNDVHLEKSRANPALVQALVSPVLTNGLGTINFSYTVSGGTAVYAIDRTDEGVQQNWTTVAVFTNAPGETGTRYVTVRENFTGRIRIRLMAESDRDARLMIDDAEARDYPPRDDTTWQAYNVMVTDWQTNRLYTGQSCYLNNSATNDVSGTGVALSEHQPFVQTPSVGTGIGEIAFWVRAWTATNTTVLTLKVAPTADTPDNEWTLVTNLTVEAGTSYIYFQNPRIYDLDNHVLRLYGDTNGTDRICIDNVLVTEPVRASFEIQEVRLVPVQPLVTGPVAVEVDIGRFLMNPKNVRMFLSYNPSSNIWGVANWWTAGDSPNSRKIELQPIAPGARTYRTAEDQPIPAAAVDKVIQFYVWGTHYEPENGGTAANANKVFQAQPTFTNPEWYSPVDLNAQYEAQGWSPYYIVYSCPPYSVWVNEINPMSASENDGNEYIELIGPAQASLDGWRMERINHVTLEVIDEVCTITGFTLPNKVNGWGFFVWGDAGVANVNKVFLDVKENLPRNAGLVLYRSCGAIEQKVCWGSSAKTSLESRGYLYTGNKGFFGTSPLCLITHDLIEAGATIDDFYWPESYNGNYTPGDVNDGQRLADIAPPPSGYVFLTSVIGPNGTHDGTYVPLISEQVDVGASPQIPYVADAWYRIATFESNGQDVPEARGASNYIWQVASIDANISNHVTFAAVDTYGDIPVEWLKQWSEQQVADGDNDNFDVATEYLLNTDPTLDTEAALRVTDIRFVDGELQVTVKLDRDNFSKIGPINGTLWLQSRASLLSGEFEDIANTAVTGEQFDQGGDTHTYVFPGVTDDSLFYRAIIK